MKVSAVYANDTDDQPPVKNHPRKYLDEQLRRNYPGVNLHDLDKHNKPVIPGRPDTPAMAALRKAYKPSIAGGASKITPAIGSGKSSTSGVSALGAGVNKPR